MDPAASRSPGERFERLRRTRTSRAALAAFAGLGLAVSGVTLVRAADDSGILDTIRSDSMRRLAKAATLREPMGAARRRSGERAYDAAFASASEAFPPRRSAEGPDGPRRKPVVRRARLALSGLGASVASRRTICVRTCDGYAFPLGTLRSAADLPSHRQACEAACPGAATALYTLAPGRGLEGTALARSAQDGSPYRRLTTAFLFQKTRVPSCSCQGPDHIAKRVPILLDPTLRAGDVVMDRGGEAKAFAGAPKAPHSPRAFADYRRSPALGRTARAQVDRAVGTSYKEALARDFQRSLRVRQAAVAERRPGDASPPRPAARAALPEIRYAALREVAPPPGSAANVRAFAYAPAGGAPAASAARIIEIR